MRHRRGIFSWIFPFTDFSLILSLSVLSAGIFFVLPCTDSIVKVDLRTVSFDIPPQEVQQEPLVNTRLAFRCPWVFVAQMWAAGRPLWLEMLDQELTLLCVCSRSWPRTRWRCVWMEWFTSGSMTPSRPWPKCPTLTLPPACWPRPRWGTCSERRTWLKFYPTARKSPMECRYMLPATTS